MNAPTLDREQMQLIAALLDHPGYTILLTAVQAEIDFAADQMDATATYDADIRGKAHWRALRRLYVILRDTPQAMHDEIEREAVVPKTSLEEFMTNGQDNYAKYLLGMHAHSTPLQQQQ